MSTVAAGPLHRAREPRAGSQVPTFARLFRTELHRLWARRFVRLLLLLAVLGYVALFAVTWADHSRTDAADLAQATTQRDQQLAQFRAGYAECVRQAPAGQSEEQCGDEPTADGFDPTQYLKKHPLRPEQLSDLALGIGAGMAALGFIVAATFIGAEWSSKNLIAWLFFEPRRLRLLGAKLLALLSSMLALSALAQVVFAFGGRILLHYRGLGVSTLPTRAANFDSDLALVQLRAGLLVLATALLGFGLANLIRNSAAAFGISFLYFAVAESLLRHYKASWQPYLFTDSIGAWVTRGGITVYGNERYDPRINGYTQQEIHVSNLHGGVTLLVYAGVVTLLSAWLFRRRDIS
jgi:ABC-2 type transport system permease protein